MSDSKDTSSDLTLPVILFITFLVLKLTGVIHWSWWWVTAPLWVAPAFLVFAAAVWLVCCTAYHTYEKLRYSVRK